MQLLRINSLVLIFLTQIGHAQDTYGFTVKGVTIGNQVWMAENLNFYVDGSSCYNDDPDYCEKYGRLYTWEAAKRAADRILGWHLPTDEEWKTLEMALGMSRSEANRAGFRGPGIGTKLKSGFEALLAGLRDSRGYFYNLGDHGLFWSASPDGSSRAWYRGVYPRDSTVHRSSDTRTDRYSVRLVKDKD